MLARRGAQVLVLCSLMACGVDPATAPAPWSAVTVSARALAVGDRPEGVSRYWVRFTNVGAADAWFLHEQRVERLHRGQWVPALDGDTWMVEGARAVRIEVGSAVDYATFFTTRDVPPGTFRLVVRLHESADRNSSGRWIASEPLELR